MPVLVDEQGRGEDEGGGEEEPAAEAGEEEGHFWGRVGLVVELEVGCELLFEVWVGTYVPLCSPMVLVLRVLLGVDGRRCGVDSLFGSDKLSETPEDRDT